MLVRDARIGTSVQMCEGAAFGRVVIENAPYTGINTGQGMRFAETSAHVESLHTRGVEHNAVIAETSCEQQNDFLDRALVVPTVDNLGVEFFRAGTP